MTDLFADATEAREKWVEERKQDDIALEKRRRQQMLDDLRNRVKTFFPNYLEEFEFFSWDDTLDIAAQPVAQVGDVKFVCERNTRNIGVLFPCDSNEDHWAYMGSCWSLDSFGAVLEKMMRKCDRCLKEEEEEEEEKTVDPKPIMRKETREDRVFRKLMEILYDVQADIDR